MRWGLIYTILATCLCACGSHPGKTPDYFASSAEFAAKRARETIVLQDLSYQAALVHVTETLMDLDCSFQESNQQFGVISARGSARMVHTDAWHAPLLWQGCAGHRVTVTVTPRANRDIAVRASFSPPSAEADQAFRHLLRRSLTVKPKGAAS